MFSVDNDTNPAHAMPYSNGGRPKELCGMDLGKAMINAFGVRPEPWKITTQCPDPNHPTPGTSTMHASSVDLSQPLFALHKVGKPTAPVFVPTPNHSHVVDNARVNAGAIWWDVRPVLVMDIRGWPSAEGMSGITSATERMPRKRRAVRSKWVELLPNLQFAHVAIAAAGWGRELTRGGPKTYASSQPES